MDQFSGQSAMTAREYHAMQNERARAPIMGGETSCGKEPRVLGGVEQQLNRLASGVEAVHQALSGLESRISVVLMQEPPSPAKSAEMPMFSPVGLTNRLGMTNNQIESAHQRIVSMLERIDL